MPRLNLDLPDDLHQALRDAATADDRTLNREILAICRQHLTERGLLPADQPATDQ